jgi:hypothetical protein
VFPIRPDDVANPMQRRPGESLAAAAARINAVHARREQAQANCMHHGESLAVRNARVNAERGQLLAISHDWQG